MIGEDGSENRRLRPSRGSPSGCQEEDRVVGSARGLRASHRRRESVREFPGPFAPLRDFSRTLRPFRSPAMPLDFWRTLIISGLKWSEWRDSNPRPLVPQTSALTGLRYTPTALLIGAVAAARNVAVQPSASRRRRAGLRKDSLRFRDFVQRFAQRRELVLREPGTTLWRATIFRSPGGGRLGGDCGSYGRSDGR
jgi:hypothetical protein